MLQFAIADTTKIPIIQDLAQQSWNEAYKEILSPEQIDYMLSNFNATSTLENQITDLPDYHYYLMKYNDNWVGFFALEHHNEPGTTKLHKLYLLPDAKGLGLGKKAIYFIQDIANDYMDNRIILNVNKYNNAKFFYETLGFTTYDSGIFDIGNGYVMDDFLMEKIIILKVP
jgi:GNAT superfamily N-acetyltransferase